MNKRLELALLENECEQYSNVHALGTGVLEQCLLRKGRG